jgi:4-hydroxybenzoate polyprenyltransferase
MTTAVQAEVVPADSWPARLSLALGDIKIAHSVFALPFAILGAVMAWKYGNHVAPGAGWGRLLGLLALIVGCMVLARSWAMLVNRVADREYDARNPRTTRRAVARGALRAQDARLMAVLCAAGFIGLCALFGVFFANWWPLILSAPTLAWIAFYSFTKRFTAAAHLFLGGALAASPLAAAIAVDPASLAHTPALWWLAGMVLFWVAGFDVLYALQDLDFDRGAGLKSIPAWLGARRAIWVSRAMHALAFVSLVIAWGVDPRLGATFGVAVGLVGAALVAEHWWLARHGVLGLPVAFGVLNGVISCTAGLFGVVDVLA